MTHFKKLSFCSRGNLYSLIEIKNKGQNWKQIQEIYLNWTDRTFIVIIHYKVLACLSNTALISSFGQSNDAWMINI